VERANVASWKVAGPASTKTRPGIRFWIRRVRTGHFQGGRSCGEPQEPSLSPEEQQALVPSADTILPVLKKKVEPVYPEGARAERSNGHVTVHCAVFPDGVPVPLAVLATNDRRFVRSAVEAIRQWRYEPARRGGEAILVRYNVLIRFTIR
jgi:protein TonB